MLTPIMRTIFGRDSSDMPKDCKGLSRRFVDPEIPAVSALPTGRDRRASALRFLRFCCVGAAGFVTDTGILVALTSILGMNPLGAKALSFAVAVLVTFELNRRWAFETGREVRPLAAFTAYLVVQTVGFVCNWTVFTACITLLPKPFGSVLVAATIASAAALVLNYLGAARLVFVRTIA